MKKTLRLVLMSMFVLFAGQAMAEDIIWSEDWSGWSEYVKVDPNGINPNYTFTGTTYKDDGSYKGGTAVYNESTAGGEAPELLVAKNGGTFVAKVALNGKSGDMVLAYKCNKNLTVTAEGATIGEVTKTGNDYLYPVTVAGGTSEITITFTMEQTSNARLDNIKLYQGSAKKPAGLSWGKASTTLYLNKEVTLVLSNENQLPVTYTSSDESVATIASDGTITLIATGKTTLTATFAGNDEFEAQTVSIEVTVKEEGGDTPGPGTETDINVAKALEIISGLEDGKTTSETYSVKGYVVGAPEFQRKADETLYGNVNFTMGDNASATDLLTVYRAKYFGNVNFTEETIGDLKDGDEVIVTGKLQKYVKDGVTTPEISSCYITSINGKTGVDDVEPTKVASIEALIGLGASANNLELTLTDAKVLFNDGNNIYVRENGKAVCFYKVDAIKELFKDNAVVNGTIRLDYELYSGLLPEVKPNVYTKTDNLTVTESEEEAVPVQTTLTRVDEGEHAGDLVTLTAKLVRKVTYKTDESGNPVINEETGEPVVSSTKYYLQDEEAELVVVNNNKNLNKLADEGVETIIVTGIVNVASSAFQIKLTKDAVNPAEGIQGDVNDDKTVDVADISAIISVMAGQANYANADVNGDGTVDVADISNVITIMAEN